MKQQDTPEAAKLKHRAATKFTQQPGHAAAGKQKSVPDKIDWISYDNEFLLLAAGLD
jgi:hypothetical protein